MPYLCPYCQCKLPMPPWPSASCPHCGRTMGIPRGAGVPRDLRERRKALDKIAHEAERQRRELKLPPGAKLGRQPGLLLAAILGLATLGGALVTMSRKVSQIPPSRRIEVAQGEISALAQALGLYERHVGHYPTEREGDLSALVADPGNTGWAGPYINRIQPDPWGRPYRYSDGITPPMLLSHGQDRDLGTEDDLRADPADFEVSEERAREWTREAQRNPTVEIAPFQTDGYPLPSNTTTTDLGPAATPQRKERASTRRNYP